MRPQCDPHATLMRPKSHHRAKAESRKQKAEIRPKPGASQVYARYMRGACEVRARCVGGASQVHGRYMRDTSHAKAGGLRRERVHRGLGPRGALVWRARGGAGAPRPNLVVWLLHWPGVGSEKLASAGGQSGVQFAAV